MKASHLRVVSILNADGQMAQSRELLAQTDVIGALYKGWVYDSEGGDVFGIGESPAFRTAFCCGSQSRAVALRV